MNKIKIVAYLIHFILKGICARNVLLHLFFPAPAAPAGVSAVPRKEDINLQRSNRRSSLLPPDGLVGVCQPLK